jgi:hypothetical protein
LLGNTQVCASSPYAAASQFEQLSVYGPFGGNSRLTMIMGALSFCGIVSVVSENGYPY